MDTELNKYKAEAVRLQNLKADLHATKIKLHDQLDDTRKRFSDRMQKIEEEKAVNKSWKDRLNERYVELEEKFSEVQCQREKLLREREQLKLNYNLAVQERDSLSAKLNNPVPTTEGRRAFENEKDTSIYKPGSNRNPANLEALFPQYAVNIHATPATSTIHDITKGIRGGVLESLAPFWNEESGMTDYEVIFRTSQGCQAFLDHAHAQNGVLVGGVWCKVSRALAKNSSARNVITSTKNMPRTRVLVMRDVPKELTTEVVQEYLVKNKGGLRTKMCGSELLTFNGNDITIFCDSIFTASSHLNHLRNYAKSHAKSLEIIYGRDECEGPVSELPVRIAN